MNVVYTRAGNISLAGGVKECMVVRHKWTLVLALSLLGTAAGWMFAPMLPALGGHFAVPRLPRFEPLLSREGEWSCELVNLAPRSDVIVIGESSEFQMPAFHAIRAIYQSPWGDDEKTARLENEVRVEAVVKSGTRSIVANGQRLSYFHHVATRALAGCSLREGTLTQGYHLLFLKHLPDGQFRLARDLQSSTVRLDGDYKGLVPSGETDEIKILSLLIAQAKRTPEIEDKRRTLTRAFHWIQAWEVEAEMWQIWQRERASADPAMAALVCEAGSQAYWWDMGCAETARRVLAGCPTDRALRGVWILS